MESPWKAATANTGKTDDSEADPGAAHSNDAENSGDYRRNARLALNAGGPWFEPSTAHRKNLLHNPDASGGSAAIMEA